MKFNVYMPSQVVPPLEIGEGKVTCYSATIMRFLFPAIHEMFLHCFFITSILHHTPQKKLADPELELNVSNQCNAIIFRLEVLQHNMLDEFFYTLSSNCLPFPQHLDMAFYVSRHVWKNHAGWEKGKNIQPLWLRCACSERMLQ